MKKSLFWLTVAAVFFGVYTLAYAASLTRVQINAILALLRAFGADERMVADVAVSLGDTSYSPQPSSPSTSNTQSPTPIPSKVPYATTKPDYDINVLVVSYFPYSEGGKLLNDPAVDKTILPPLGTIRKSSSDLVRMMKEAIEESSKYLGYKDPGAEPALRYYLDSREYFTATPYRRHFDKFLLDYPKILKAQNICSLVDQKNVSEIWIMIPSHTADYDHKEFLLVGPYETFYPDWDDFSSELPICSKTYKVITHGYNGWGSDQFMTEVWGHMLEYEMRRADEGLFYLFQGPCYGSDNYTCRPLEDKKKPIVGRCGNMHNPPNATEEYERDNTTSNNSDCRAWNPDGLGALSPVSCVDWGCVYKSMFDNPVRNWIVWNWQNMPGRNNTKTYQDKKLRNWWDVHGNYDKVIGGGEGLLFNGPQVPLPNLSFSSQNAIVGGTISISMCSAGGILMPESAQVGITLDGIYRQFVVRRFDLIREGCIKNSYDVSRWGVSYAQSATISLDPKNIIRESNESDNQITIWGAVSTPTPTPTQIPLSISTPSPSTSPAFEIVSVNLNPTTLTINGANVKYTMTFKNSGAATTGIAMQVWIKQGSAKRAAGGALVGCGGSLGAVGANVTCSSGFSIVAKDQSPIAGSGLFLPGAATAIFQIKNSTKVLAEKTVAITLVSSTPSPASPATASAIESLHSTLQQLQTLLSNLKNQ